MNEISLYYDAWSKIHQSFLESCLCFFFSTADIEKGNIFLCNSVYSLSLIDNKNNLTPTSLAIYPYTKCMEIQTIFLCAAVDHVIVLTKQRQSTPNGHMRTISQFCLQTVDYI